MTLVVAWHRVRNGVDELVVASDSRTTGYGRWDTVPKILEMPRADCVLAFAGDVTMAMPIAIQAQQAIAAYGPARSRATPLSSTVSHVENVINECLAGWNESKRLIASNPKNRAADVEIMISGWDWNSSRYAIWHGTLDRSAKRFVLTAIKERNGLLFHFIGDEAKSAKGRLLRRTSIDASTSLGNEPWEVLLETILDPEAHTVSGTPQVMKVYRHGDSVICAVDWNGVLHVSGRPLLGYENISTPIVDRELRQRSPFGPSS